MDGKTRPELAQPALEAAHRWCKSCQEGPFTKVKKYALNSRLLEFFFFFFNQKYSAHSPFFPSEQLTPQNKNELWWKPIEILEYNVQSC